MNTKKEKVVLLSLNKNEMKDGTIYRNFWPSGAYFWGITEAKKYRIIIMIRKPLYYTGE